MPERKPRNQTWESFAEQQIQSAQQAGAFDNLPGAGQPLPGIDAPLELDWWLKRKLKEEQLEVLPPLLEARRDIERTRREIAALRTEAVVREQLQQLAKRVRAAIMSPHPSPPVFILPIDVEEEVRRWRSQRDGRHAQ